MLVGVSGGPDSLCLLHILNELKDELGIELIAAHLNHMLRGEEAEEDAAFVAAEAQRLNLPLVLERRDVRGEKLRRGLSLEEAARAVRFRFFAEAASKTGASKVALGHTADDQVETVLLHLLRGTGLAGLRGMEPASTWREPDLPPLIIIRPLLRLWREDTEAFCARRGLSPRRDSTNLSLSPLRNRIRLELLPQMERMNPGIKKLLAAAASSLSLDYSFIQEEVGKAISRIVRREDEAAIIDAKGFSELHPSIQRHLIRNLLAEILGGYEELKGAHIEDLVRALRNPAGKRLQLPGGLKFIGEHGRGILTRREEAEFCPLPPLAGEHEIPVPGEVEIPGWRIKAEILEKPSPSPPPLPQDPYEGFFDLEAAGRKLKVRTWREGDRFRPLGMRNYKKLQDFFVDEHIPRSWRSRIPIVCSSDEIMWVVGWRIDDRFRAKPETRLLLHLIFQKGGSL